MKRAITLLLVSCIVLGACTQRMICPAYQSAFIYDKEALRKKFSYFQDDSTPKVLMASKNKYLVAAPVSYQKKIRSMQTVPMKPVYPVVPDSLRDDFEVSLAELDSAARSVIDSTYIVDVEQKADSTQTAEDSVYVITKDKEVRLLKYNPDSLKYSVVNVRLNIDQDNYMWYLRDYLILPDVKISKMQGEAKAHPKKEKKGFFGFFKNLFKKKKKEQTDSTLLTAPVKDENDFDYIDTLAHEKPVVTTDKASKKESKKKEKKAKKKEQELTTDEALTPEDKPKRKKKKKDDPVPEDTDKPSRMGSPEEKDDGF
jgi:hypothetical protein